MFMYKLLDAINEGKSVDIYNNGDHIRDFTFVDDIVSGIISSHKNNTNGSKIYNLGNNKPVELMKVVEIIENNMNKSATKKLLTYAKRRCLQNLCRYKRDNFGIKLETDNND